MAGHLALSWKVPRDWYFIAEQPAPASHLAHPEGCAALGQHILAARIVLGKSRQNRLGGGLLVCELS